MSPTTVWPAAVHSSAVVGVAAVPGSLAVVGAGAGSGSLGGALLFPQAHRAIASSVDAMIRCIGVSCPTLDDPAKSGRKGPMNVLIADKFEDSGRAALTAAGCVIEYRPGTKDQALVDAIRATDPEVLIVRSTKVTRA